MVKTDVKTEHYVGSKTIKRRWNLGGQPPLEWWLYSASAISLFKSLHCNAIIPHYYEKLFPNSYNPHRV